IDDVVQKVNPKRYDSLEAIVIDVSIAVKPGEIYRTKDAGFIRQQRLFAAWVGAFDLTKLRRRVISVYPIDKNYTGLAVAPGRVHDSIQHASCVQLPHDIARSRVDQGVPLAASDSIHELIGHCNRDVEGVQLEWICFGSDELLDVRMIDAQDRHICAGAFPAKLCYLGSKVVQAHERNRTAGNSVR